MHPKNTLENKRLFATGGGVPDPNKPPVKPAKAPAPATKAPAKK